jgi:hypothetical protein
VTRNTRTTYAGYSMGDLVLMKPIPEEPDLPRERLIILSFDVMPWGVSIIGEVPVEDRAPDDRDGLREFTIDQIEGKVE